MTDKKTLADGVSDHTDDSPHAHRAAGRRWTGFLAHRWPTALGVAVAALTAYDMDLDDGILVLSPLTVLMALVYLGAAALDWRRFAWVVFLAGLLLLFFIPSTSAFGLSVGFLVAALVFLVLRVARGLLRRLRARAEDLRWAPPAVPRLVMDEGDARVRGVRGGGRLQDHAYRYVEPDGMPRGRRSG